MIHILEEGIGLKERKKYPMTKMNKREIKKMLKSKKNKKTKRKERLPNQISQNITWPQLRRNRRL